MARSGVFGAEDLLHNVDGVHFEVKGNEGFDIGTKLLSDAVQQSNDHKLDDVPCCMALVLWKRNYSGWRISRRTLCDTAPIQTYDAHDFLVNELGWELATEEEGGESDEQQ